MQKGTFYALTGDRTEKVQIAIYLFLGGVKRCVCGGWGKLLRPSAGWPCAVYIMEVISMYLVAERERRTRRRRRRRRRKVYSKLMQ